MDEIENTELIRNFATVVKRSLLGILQIAELFEIGMSQFVANEILQAIDNEEISWEDLGLEEDDLKKFLKKVYTENGKRLKARFQELHQKLRSIEDRKTSEETERELYAEELVVLQYGAWSSRFWSGPT